MVELAHNMNPTGRGYRIPMPCSGIYAYPMDPRPEEFHIEDTAHKLANQCRYGGGTIEFYSVAEHCCLLHDWIRPQLKRAALLHDRAEAWLQDVLRPQKQLCQPWYGNMERRIEEVSAPVFKVPYPNPDEVMEADYRICIDEKHQAYGKIQYEAENDIERNALPNRPGHDKGALGVMLRFWTPYQAKYEFLRRWNELEEMGL